MKRISIFLAVCLAVLSFGLVNAQPIEGGAMELLNPPAGDSLFFENSYTFQFQHNNSTSEAQDGVTNGFTMYTDNGAGFTVAADNQKWIDVSAPLFNGGQFVNEFSLDGAGADTIGFAAFKISSPGLAAGETIQGIDITVTIGDSASGATLFCIDSAFYPPGGEWLWAGATGQGYNPVWNGPFCYDLRVLQNQCPVIDPAPPVTVEASHCEVLEITFTATDPDDEDDPPFVWTVTDGIGSFGPDDGTGSATWEYAPSAADVGASLSSTIEVCDQRGGCCEHTINFTFTNIGPAFTDGCDDVTKVGMGGTALVDMDAEDGDCDDLTYSILSVTPAPVGTYSIDGDGLITFNTVSGVAPAGDGGETYVFEVQVEDEAGATAVCNTTIDVTVLDAFEVTIQKTGDDPDSLAYIGLHELVNVTVEKGSEEMGGFDFLIAYDASALTFTEALEGPAFYAGGCGWEYFTYTFGPNGNCGGPCPSGLVRVIGIAETNNGPNHPSCYAPDFPATLFTLDFLVSSDATLECQYVPIRFYWMDCGDNTIASKSGDTLFVSDVVTDFAFDTDFATEIQNDSTGFPTYTGIQKGCFVDLDPGKPAPFEFIDFNNGGIDIVCADSIDARADLNLNEIPYEIADAVLYSNYFVYGLGAFHYNLQGQIAASDVNADGITLSVADLVYLIRVIRGDANPYVKVSPVSTEYTVNGSIVSVDDAMGAAHIVVSGNAAPELLADGMEMKFNYDGQNTQVLVYSMDLNTFQGEFLNAGGNVVSIEFGSPAGGTVTAKGTTVPNTYELAQNYPNPFNPTTTIEFSLEQASQYTLSIYNVTGQKVHEVSDMGNAGQNSVVWDASGQASGVYFYKLESDNFSATKKMMLLK
ncbi:T9SS type A sorting domain-containing protein [candidate division GN15 bacterium]|nr:T9SS type A sorting domain-containing protein [candidate division GN15 bacterium]